tara:strand:- start:560 stop:757 length:198 start_codon:yes stop_codon:yes gene_type:complete
MKIGDIVVFQNLHEDWGDMGLVTDIRSTSLETGQIYILARGRSTAIPVHLRDKYIQEIIEIDESS